MQKFSHFHFLKEKKFYPKKSLMSLLHQPIQLTVFLAGHAAVVTYSVTKWYQHVHQWLGSFFDTMTVASSD